MSRRDGARTRALAAAKLLTGCFTVDSRSADTVHSGSGHEDQPIPTAEVVSFRSFSRLSAIRRDAALAAAALAIEVATWIDERFELPAPDLPDLRGVEPRTAAAVVRATWALGNDPAPNIVHLLEAHGVRVYSLVDECADLDGFSTWWDGVPYVFLTQHKSPERGRWDAAHELGHLVLDLDGAPQGREREQAADAFASEFLLPESGVRATAPRFPSLLDVRREKVTWESRPLRTSGCCTSSG